MTVIIIVFSQTVVIIIDYSLFMTVIIIVCSVFITVIFIVFSVFMTNMIAILSRSLHKAVEPPLSYALQRNLVL